MENSRIAVHNGRKVHNHINSSTNIIGDYNKIFEQNLTNSGINFKLFSEVNKKINSCDNAVNEKSKFTDEIKRKKIFIKPAENKLVSVKSLLLNKSLTEKLNQKQFSNNNNNNVNNNNNNNNNNHNNKNELAKVHKPKHIEDHLKLEVKVIELLCDDENNNDRDTQATCWYRFLSLLCAWKMSGDVLDNIQTARVQDSETWDIEKRSKYTVYKVVVHSGSSSWFVFRRYAEFHKLFESLRKQFPGLQLKLPGKKLFGNNLDPNFVAMRQDGLDSFVQNIINQSSLHHLPEVREFFKLDNKYRNLNAGVTKEETVTEEIKSENKLNLGPSERSHAQPSDFDFLRVIGQGSFGKVLLAKHKTENKYYAVKVLKKKQVMRKNEAKHIMSERNVLLKTLNHPFLVGLYYSFQTAEKLYFVLDYVNGGELFFHLQRERVFSESRSQFYAAEMACALGYLHSKGIIYRDLKPENILLDAQGHIVLTDFGLSKEGLLGTDTTKTFCGTPEYLAPEIILKEAYDRSVDWWCLGTVLYEMLFGLPPFYCQDTSEMYDRILKKPLVIKTTVSESARDILNRLLEKDRSKRLGSGYGDFDDVQRHQFFRHINWDHLVAKKIKPPFNPLVRGVLDLKHIDPQFTKEQVPASIEQNTDEYLNASVKEADDVFAGFSYAPPTAELSA